MSEIPPMRPADPPPKKGGYKPQSAKSQAVLERLDQLRATPLVWHLVGSDSDKRWARSWVSSHRDALKGFEATTRANDAGGSDLYVRCMVVGGEDMRAAIQARADRTAELLDKGA